MEQNDDLNNNTSILKKEVTRAILNLEDKWSQKHFEYDGKITSEISKIEFQLSEIIKKQEAFSEFTQIQYVKNQKQNEIIQQIDKINDQLMSLDIRINNNVKELNDAIYKYDYLYLNNLLLPGHIGESCKYKNLREFLNYAISQISSFDIFKEKLNVDLKSYKERLENIIKGFNMQIDRIKNSNMTYSNEKVFELKESIDEQIKDLYANFPEIQMKNQQFVINLKKQMNDLIKEREMITKLREEVLLDMNNKCNQIKEENHHTNNQIGEYKAEFGKIKRSYIELAEFIKDVRFKRNINSEISKEQLNKLAFKLSKEKEKLSEEQIEECHQRKVDDLLESIIKNGDIKHLTNHNDQTNTSKSSRAHNTKTHEKNKYNDIRLDSISEGESINMTVLLDENNKINTNILLPHTVENKRIEPKSQQRLRSSFSSTDTRMKRVSLKSYQQSTMKKLLEGNEKRIKEIEELTQAKISELEKRINNFHIKETSIVTKNESFPQGNAVSVINRKDDSLNSNPNTCKKEYVALNTGNNQTIFINAESSPRHSFFQGSDSTNIISQQISKNSQYFPISKPRISKIRNMSFTKNQESKLPYFELRPADQVKKKNKPALNVPVSRVLSPNATSDSKGDKGDKGESQTIIHTVSSHFLKPLKNCLDTINQTNPLYKISKGDS